MPTQYLVNYLEKKDKYGVRVGDWAKQADKGFVSCKYCVHPSKFGISKGLGDLTRHSENQKHRAAVAASKEDSQTTLADHNFTVNDPIKAAAKEFEIDLVAVMAHHGVPSTIFDCLTATMKKHITDSDIVKEMKLGREKARCLLIGGLGEHFKNETITKMKNSDAFSVALDESQVNKRSELEITVKLSNDEGIESRHYKSLDIEDGKAETITNAVIEEFEKDGIDFRSKLIHVETDGCNTMIGSKNGVQLKFQKKIPHMRSIGSCGAHNVSNVMKHATKAFDGDVVKTLVDIYYDLGGAPGKGLAKKHEFEKICESIGLIPVEFKKYVDTRFRTLIHCIPPVLHNYQGMVAYYKSIPEKKLTERQVLLKRMFVDNQDITKIKLLFVLDATAELARSVSFFEENQVDVHNVMSQVEEILTTQYRRVFREESIYNLNENETLELKPKKELIELDLVKTEVLDEKMIFIGKSVETEIKSLGLRPNSPQLSWFYQKVKCFHLKACEFLQKYFKPVVTSKVLECAEALDPNKQSHALTPRRLKYLVDQYPTIVENIQRIGGVDQIKNEIDKYVLDVDVRLIDHSKGYEHSWKELNKLQKGSWARYDVLGRFALAMGTIYTATSDVERQFSKMNLIHQFKQRNIMSHETLNAHLTVKCGMENYSKKSHAEGNIKPAHCYLVVNKSLREKCQESYKIVRSSTSKMTDVRRKEMELRKQASDELEKVRVDKLKEKYRNGGSLWKEENLKPVYAVKKANDNQSKEKDVNDNTSKKDDNQSKKKDVNDNSSKKADDNQSKKKKNVNDNTSQKASENIPPKKRKNANDVVQGPKNGKRTKNF